MKVLVFLFVLAAFGFTQTALACEALQKLRVLSPDLADAHEQLLRLDPETLQGRAVSFDKRGQNWQIVNSVEEAQKHWAEQVERARQTGKWEEAQRILILSAPELRESSPVYQSTKDPRDPPYKPTEYELNASVRQAIEKINRDLPPEAHLPVLVLTADPRMDSIRAASLAALKKQEERFEAFIPTTGFKSMEDYRQAVEDTGGIEKQIFDLLDQENLQVAVRKPQRGRWWVLRTGLHNQFVTGSSEGLLSHSQRNEVESFYLGLQKSDYEGEDPEFKPLYGHIRPPRGHEIRPYMSDNYGEDDYVLPVKEVGPFMTWTPGDSLNRHDPENVEHWDQLFVPWKYRTLWVPALAQGVRADGTLHVERNGTPSYPSDHPLGAFRQHWRAGSNYTEVQIFGPWRLENVSEFEFHSSPPDAEMLQGLTERDILIYDARGSEPTLWTPPSSEGGEK